MYSKEYLIARDEFWNCIRMIPFTVGISLFFAFKEWKPIMNQQLRKTPVNPVMQKVPA